MSGEAEVLVEGEVLRVTFESVESGFRVVKLQVEGRDDRLAVVGRFPPIAVGARVRVRGTMVTDKRHGEQLRAEMVTELAPSTLVGLERYLGSGSIPGIGERYAKRIVETFGLDTLRVLEEDPERLREIEGLGDKRVVRIAKAWREQKVVREVMVFLQAHGASAALALRIWKRYGANAIHMVSRDPYRLALDVWGIGFRTADRLASALGIAKDSAERTQAGVLQTLHDVTEAGHVYTPLDDLFAHATKMLEQDDSDGAVRERLLGSVHALEAAGHVVIDSVGDAKVAYASRMYACETRIADAVARMARARSAPLDGALGAVASFERRTGLSLAPEQREAVASAARSALLVVTGGPGVGKTTIVRAILALFDAAELPVRLAAPTGRAAKRMSEATERDASTLHRLLEFDPKHGVFRRDASRPLDAGAIVVDEASMLDAALADALFQAVAPGCRLVLVGDVDQLPSVGPGAVLKDVISSGAVRSVLLRKIFRQAQTSLIVTNAHRINDGLPPLLPEAGDGDADFFMVERRDPEAATKTVVELVRTRIPRKFGLDPIRDIQVLTPMHRGAAGSHALNEALQAALNPGSPSMARGNRTFCIGDKVMQLKNDYERSVYNGDVGIITRLDAEQDELYVSYDSAAAGLGEREVKYDSSSIDELSVAYASSIHKAQGSEYPAVVIPFLTSHFVMLSRNLLYTAVTLGGRRLVVLVSDSRAIKLALAEDRRDERRTRLADRIKRALGAMP